MTFAELKAELAARGFDYLSDTRLGYYINDARQQLDNRYLWPYREKGVTGSTPLTVLDLGVIEAVTNETAHYSLQPTTYQRLLDDYGDLSTSGLAHSFYVATPAGVPAVVAFPETEDTIGVQYWRRTAALAADDDQPASPEDYHLLIVDMATQRAYMDSDNFPAAGALQGFIESRLLEMANALLGGQQIAGPQEQQSMTGQSVDS